MYVRITSSAPRYQEIANTLRQRIRTGAYPRGSKIPSEAELQQDTGYSRSTVRKALDVLVQEGLLVKERGRGAFVASSIPAADDDLTFTSFTANMAGGDATFRTKTVDAKMAAADDDVAAFLQLDPGSPLVELVRLRYLDDTPFCLETTFLTHDYAALLDENLDGSLYDVLRTHYQRIPGHGHKTFEAHTASAAEAFLLDVERGAALMLVTDYVLDGEGAPLHVSRRVLRTDRVKYTEPIG